MSLFISIFISTLGFSYFLYGKKSSNPHFLIFGIILMIYPYLIPGVFTMLFLGIIFIILPFITKNIF